jgi:hypothetical protein
VSAELFSSDNVVEGGGAEVPKNEAKAVVAGDAEVDIAGGLAAAASGMEKNELVEFV